MTGKTKGLRAFLAAALLAALLATIWTGCAPIDGGSGSNGMARITIRADRSGARTILPNFAEPLSYKLTVSAGPTSVEPLVEAAGDFDLELEYGVYDFLIQGYDEAGGAGSVTCSGTVPGRTVDEDTTIVVTVAPGYSAGSGSALVVLFWPKNITPAQAEFACLPVGTEPESGDWETAIIVGNQARFQESSLASGSYSLYYRLQESDGGIVRESRAIQIATGLESSAAIGLGYGHFDVQPMLDAGYNAITYVKADGSMWTWGSDQYGLRGRALSATVDPFPSQMASGGWAQADVEWTDAVGIKSDGSIWTWGQSDYGNSGAQYLPGRLGSDNDWIRAEIGSGSIVAVKADGSLWSLGLNSYGQLGLGDTEYHGTLTRIGVDSDWVDVTVGSGSVWATKADGSLWSWGSDAYGALGNGSASTSNVLAPARIGADSDWASVFEDGGAAFGLKTDGSLYAWGYNQAYQLGLGAVSTQIDDPTRVGTDNDWKRIDSYFQNVAALKNDGSLWTWGGAGAGGLGNGMSSGTVYVPTRIGSEYDWIAVTMGMAYGAALKADGTVLVWGYNVNGQLGDGTIIEKLAPSINSLVSFPVSFNLNGATGTAPVPQSVRYNGTATAPVAPTCDFHDFLGWFLDEAGTQSWTFATSLVTADTILYAAWDPMDFSAGLSVLLESPTEESISLGANQSLTKSDTLNVSVVESFDAYRWYLDGTLLSGQSAESLSLAMASYASGRHNLTALVQKDGLWYSKNLYFNLSD